MTTPLLVLVSALVFAGVGFAGVSFGKKLYLSGNQQRMLPSGRRSNSWVESQRAMMAIDLFNDHVEMYRGRAVRVLDEEVTIVFSRKNGTKGRVKFTMDKAFETVSEGDTGVFVIIDQEAVGSMPFYKFIRDASTPDIDDVLAIGTGDSLTDEIYSALRESKRA